MMGFTWTDSTDRMKYNETVKMLFVVPVLRYKTSKDRMSLDQFWPSGIKYCKIDV